MAGLPSLSRLCPRLTLTPLQLRPGDTCWFHNQICPFYFEVLTPPPLGMWTFLVYWWPSGQEQLCVCACVLERGNERGKCAKCLHLARLGLLPLSNKTCPDFTLVVGRVVFYNWHPSQHKKDILIWMDGMNPRGSEWIMKGVLESFTWAQSCRDIS